MLSMVKALLCLGGLAFFSPTLFGQSLDVVHLDEVELTVYDLKLAFTSSLEMAYESLEKNPIQTYNYQEFIEHSILQLALTRQFELEYAPKGHSTNLEVLRWVMLKEQVAHCKSNKLPFPDMVFLNQTLHLKFYQQLFTQFVDRLVITEETQRDKNVSIKVFSKALGAIDRLSAHFEIDKDTKHINRISLSLVIDPSYEANAQQWRTRTLFIDIAFHNGLAHSYEAHTALHSRQKRVLEPLIFRQHMHLVHFQEKERIDQAMLQMDLKKALKPPCAL
jgi:hypothetical protein